MNELGLGMLITITCNAHTILRGFSALNLMSFDNVLLFASQIVGFVDFQQSNNPFLEIHICFHRALLMSRILARNHWLTIF